MTDNTNINNDEILTSIDEIKNQMLLRNTYIKSIETNYNDYLKDNNTSTYKFNINIITENHKIQYSFIITNYMLDTRKYLQSELELRNILLNIDNVLESGISGNNDPILKCIVTIDEQAPKIAMIKNLNINDNIEDYIIADTIKEVWTMAIFAAYNIKDDFLQEKKKFF